MNAIPSSKAEKAIMKDKGNRAMKKYINPLAIMLYVNPARTWSIRWPASTLAASLNPKDTFLDKYETNSIRTNNGTNPSGHPEGTNREKNLTPCFCSPRIVAPRTIEKLMEKVKTKWDVEANPYGIIPIKLLTRININKEKINGK